MSTRQKKQRKGRNNPNNRERTVTTLTEDPHTPYLVPTPSEEPAGSHMPFLGPATGKLQNMPMGQQAYQMPGNFGFGYAAPYGSLQHTNMHQNQQQHQQYFSPSQAQRQQQPTHAQQQESQDQQTMPVLPPGKNDLEILQNLKKIIKDGQHPFYRAIPSPAVLASLYKGPIPTQSQTQGHRADQGPPEPHSDSNASRPSVSTSGFATSTADGGRWPTRTQGRDQRQTPIDPDQQTTNILQSARTSQGSRFSNAPGTKHVSNLNLGSLKIKDSPGPPSAEPQPEPRSADVSAPPTGLSSGTSASQELSDSQRQGKYDYQARSGAQNGESDPVVGARPGHGDSDYDNVRPSDPAMDVDDSMYGGKDAPPRPGSWAPRGAGPTPEERSFGSERTVTPRPNYSGGSANVDTSPSGGVGRRAGPGDIYDRDREPRKASWHQQYDHNRRPSHDQGRDSRFTDSRRPSTMPEPRPYEAELGHPPTGNRAPVEAFVPSDDHRPADSRPPANVDSQERPTDTPPSARDPHVTRLPVDPDVRPESRPAPSRPDEDVHSSRASSVRPPDTSAPLSSGPPPVSGDSLGSSDDPSPRPSLKDRIEQPATRQPRSYGEPATTAGDSHPPQERFKKRFQKNYHGASYNGPPKGDRAYGRPPPSDGPPLSGGPRSFRPADSRKMPPSPGSRGPRDFRGPPGRDVSRDRAGGYRPDFNDARRAEAIDPDAPPPRYEPRPYSDFAPPGGDRGRPGAYPPPSPPPPGGRRPSGDDLPPRDDYYQQYPPDRRDWDAGEESYYKAWRDRPGPTSAPAERERFERDYPPPRAANWDREFVARDDLGYIGGPPPPHNDRYPAGPPPPREADRGRPPPAGYAAPYSRVRGRSPSPISRPGVDQDGSRPPLKRPREGFTDYYAGARPAARRPAGEYPPPPSSAGQAPPNADWPASGPSAGGPPSERDYRMGHEPMEYAPPSSYDRPRSPGAPPARNTYGARGGYGRGGDRGVERGGYGMRPPPQ